MSSCPGYHLEDYLAWCYNLVVEDQAEANFSLGLAEQFGRIPARPRVTKVQFAELVELFEPHRDEIEDRLLDFDDDNQSWRDYAGYAFDFVPDELDTTAMALIKRLTTTGT